MVVVAWLGFFTRVLLVIFGAERGLNPRHRPKLPCAEAALGFPIAAAGTLGYVIAGLRETGLRPCAQATVPDCSIGFVYLPALVVTAAASMLLAPLGARVAHALDVRALTRVFAGLLYLLAGYMLYKGLRTH